jgi:hypothetical protein
MPAAILAHGFCADICGRKIQHHTGHMQKITSINLVIWVGAFQVTRCSKSRQYSYSGHLLKMASNYEHV